MKIFTALEVPQQAIEQIQQQTERLFKDYPSFNWIPPENYHVSLYYIGDINPQKIEVAKEHIQNALYDVPVTRMYTFGANLFINEQIVLYVSFLRNKVVEDISRRIWDLFEEPEKKRKEYIPHITVARYKVPSKQQYFHLKKKLERMKINVEFEVNEIHIYESITIHKNPIYKKVATIPLLAD